MLLEQLVEKKIINPLQRRLYEVFLKQPEAKIVFKRLFEQECLEPVTHFDALQLAWMEGRRSWFKEIFSLLDRVDDLLQQEIIDNE